MSAKRLGEAVWAGARDEYVTGNESYAEIARRLGVRTRAVEDHALNRGANGGQTWGEMREEFLDGVSGKARSKASDKLAVVLARVREKSANVAEAALKRLATKLESDQPMEDKDLIQAAKLATAVKIELGGDPNGAPVDVRATLAELTVADLKRLANNLSEDT